MTSQEVKELLIGRFTFANGYVGAVYEAPNLSSADVLAVRFGGNVQEFEIKLSKTDLVGEMRAARVAAGLEGIDRYIRRQIKLAIDDNRDMTPDQRDVLIKNGHGLSKTKLKKHRLYLTTEDRNPHYPWGPNGTLTPKPKPFVPNTFYWCIPNDLLDVCRELNKGLPYGIYVFDLPQTNKYYQKFTVKGGRSLTQQGDKLFFELFNRASTHWHDARSEISWLKYRIAELEGKAPSS